MYIFDSIGAVISNCVIPPFIIALSIGVPSLILYSLEAFILLKRHRRYNTAFFRLFIARFILNVLGHFNSFICVRLGRVGVFLDFFEMLPSKLLAFSFFFIYYAFHAENMATMFILVNRLSVVAMPMTQVKGLPTGVQLNNLYTCLPMFEVSHIPREMVGRSAPDHRTSVVTFSKVASGSASEHPEAEVWQHCTGLAFTCGGSQYLWGKIELE
ncbi:srg family chemoreceptor domain-containing protein [Ditylenchus destructor]|uniref:Serpentine receptor class gamma n=1 Tax=Ditylenchus destructor TaxID=166010 RepID=A0AAD4MW98_9BILA|nr:srg family chemoreceptor domain-containing protein [Ditylenchus destructor]